MQVISVFNRFAVFLRLPPNQQDECILYLHSPGPAVLMVTILRADSHDAVCTHTHTTNVLVFDVITDQ